MTVTGSMKAMLAAAAALCLASLAGAAAPEAAKDQDPEVTLGNQTFDELKVRAEIIESSPLYDQLKPFADAITKAAQPQYNHPFKFYLVHEAQPNAFATPGGNIYVVDSLLYFARNADELAGTLCHEVSHTIHHDTMKLMEKRKAVERRAAGAAILLGPTTGNVLAIALLSQLHSLSYSREAEAQADQTGSDICAAAGYNPWGLIWLFKDFDKADTRQIPQILSDHPNNQNRVAALEQHFRENPAVFGKFNPDRAAATPFAAIKKAPEVFLR